MSAAFKNNPEFQIIRESATERVFELRFRKVEPPEAAFLITKVMIQGMYGSRVNLTLQVNDDNELTTKLCDAAMNKLCGDVSKILGDLDADNNQD
jgi:hypothetical protein